MSRTGIEAKLPWKQIPKAVRHQVDAALGAPVLRAARIWGGYSPAPTYRLVLADGRRAFFKATYQASNEFSTKALLYEGRVYHELATLLGSWAPQFYATFHHADWHVLLLEDLGPKSVPPWTPGKARAITQALAAFHRSSLGASLPAWLSRPDERLQHENWTRTAHESQAFHQIAALADEAAPQALTWFQMITPTIEALMQQSILATEPYAILHGDLRSDNLRFVRGQLYLFDWPAITVGRPEWDVVAFAQTVTVEGGPAPEQVMTWYAEQFPLNTAALDSALAWWLTFFADRAWRPEIPGLPRVRHFQRQQLGTTVLWAARQWSLPQPAWAERLLK
jgi:fructosamine-3-kinase